MKKKLHYVLPLTLALMAFSGQSIADSHEVGKKTKPDPDCQRIDEAKVVNLNLNAKKNKANPDCVLARLGTTLVFKLTPKKGLKLGNVTIDPKSPLDTWLQGSNKHYPGLIVIEIPGVHVEKAAYEYSDYDYIIKVDGEVIDPRIQIEH